MWLSKNARKSNGYFKNEVENANLTISSSEQIEANGSTNSRNIRVYSPYGYSYVAPNGEETLLVQASFGMASAGLKMDCDNLKSGEIKISNNSGAYILLKNDGTVEINGQEFKRVTQ